MTYAFEVFRRARATHGTSTFCGENASVVTVVFILAVANLALGMALAAALDRLPPWSLPKLIRWPSARLPACPAPPESGDGHQALSGHDDWSQQLKQAGVNPKSAFERLLWIVKLETSSHRDQLLALDRVFFDPHSPQPIHDELTRRLAPFHELLESWIPQAQAEKEHAGAGGESLEELLLDQAFQVRSCLEELAETGSDGTPQQLAAATHAISVLRDRTDVLLCQVLTAEGRLHEIADCYQTFGERGTLTHLGLAALFDTWWADDPDQVRLVSLVMLDLDRFEPFTQRVGAARGDTALARFGDLLHDLVRKDRGFDRVARLSGQRFVMFLGDTSSKNAAKGAERIRQAIEATSFKLGEETFEVTASLAVIEVGKAEGPGEFIPRLEATLNECKKAGRNCGFMDSGDGPQPIRLPQYQVNVRVIELDEEVVHGSP